MSEKGKKKGGQAEKKPVEDKPKPAGDAPAPAKKNKKEKGAAAAGSEAPADGAAPARREAEYIAHRIKMWDEISQRREAENKKREEAKIEIKLPDGKKLDGIAWKTTPLDIAKSISNALAKRAMVAKVDGKMHDLHRPLERNCLLEICDWETPEGKHAFWHSSAHILGQSLEREYGCHLCVGPPLEDGGFYYDCEMGDRVVRPDEFKRLEKSIDALIKENHPFIRLEITRAESLEMFKHNKFKQEILTKIPEGETVTCYRCGPLIDLCRGPHVPSTGVVKAMKILKNSSAYWMGNANNAALQRVYGISFPTAKQLADHLALLEEAEKRDHRKIGLEQKLFFVHDFSPGSPFFLPHGARIYNKLIEFIRRQYWQRGFTEVCSPNVFNVDLWKISGHYDNYKDNMFLFESEAQEFGMKPMNCPGHCLMFKHELRSYRDLPIRFADFGVLHRNEASGALTGLTRVRRFQQDDAHIFCRLDQIEQEITGALDFLKCVYGILGFEFNVCLSTRPKKYMGELKQWDEAEEALARCLDRFGIEWKINPEDGAFYGPKIDIQLTDALKRRHQCATIQLDFQLPIRFGLRYKTESGEFERPVIVHRAVLGSVERMFAVLIEHTAGKWPFWLSPRQAILIPVTQTQVAYAEKVRQHFHELGYYVDVDDSRDQLNKKIRDAQLAQYNYILVVGPKEEESNAVNIRTRDNVQHGTKTLPELAEHFAELNKTYK